jgi:hypothetical protein
MSVLSAQQSLVPGVLNNLPVNTEFFALLSSLGLVKQGPAARTEVTTARFSSGSSTLRMGDGTTSISVPRIEGLGSLTTTYETLGQAVFVSDQELADGRLQQATLDEAAKAAMRSIQRDVESGFWTGVDTAGLAFSNLQTVKGGSTNTTGWLSPIAKGSQTNTITGKSQTGAVNWQHWAELSAATFSVARMNVTADDARSGGSGLAFSAISDACYAKYVAAVGPAAMAYTKLENAGNDLGYAIPMFGGAPLYRPRNAWLGTTVADATPTNHTLSMVSFGLDSFHLSARENRYFDKGREIFVDPRNTNQPGVGYWLLADMVFKVDRLQGISALFDAET